MIENRNAIDEKNLWDLTPLYPALTVWESDYQAVNQLADEIGRFKGTLASGPEAINEAFRFYLELSRKLEKLYTYAHLLSDGDTTNSEALALLDRAESLYAKSSAAASFLTPELLTIEESLLLKHLESPLLKDLHRMLTDIVRFRPHTLSIEEETLLAAAGEVLGAPRKVFTQLTNADFDFGELEIDGKNQPLSHGNFILYLKNSSREVRERAFNQYYRVYDQHKHTIAATYAGSVKKDCYITRCRKYPATLERSLFSDNVEREVYDKLIETTHSGLSALHRYYELRKKKFNLPTLRIYDTYFPLAPDIKVSNSYDQAVELVIDALTPLGEDYITILQKGLTDARWVDRFENKGKRSGAYSSGCFDSPPYILLNYKEDDIGSVFTLAHEAGHSMHSYYSIQSQPYQDHAYTIFVAEVASTFNEQLLSYSLRKKYTQDRQMMAFLINQQIDEIKATFYRQVMFAEFEREIHAKAQNNEPLTLETLRGVYRELLLKYFGPALELGDLDDLECLRIPHFYSAFYVYKYATGLAAAIALSEKVLNGNAEDCQRYLNFLKAGCTKHPLELLKDAGVDLTAADPVRVVLHRFETLVENLSVWLA